MAGNEEHWLDVDALSGRVKVGRAIDFEKLPISRSHPTANVKRLNFTVRANDMGNPSKFSLSFLTLFVFDVNDWKPVFPKLHHSKTLREDTAGGTQIIKMEAIDGDGSSPFNRVFYRIEHGAQDKFVIEPDTGIVRLAPGAILDYNVKPYHLLEIVALDGGGKQSEKSSILNITIKDINNKLPKFEYNDVENLLAITSASEARGPRETMPGGEKNSEVSSLSNIGGSGIFHAKVLENSPPDYYITHLRATDPDSNAVLRYSILYNISEARDERGILLRGVELSKFFVLDAIDGTLKTGAMPIDREIMETVRLAVVVEDIASATGPQLAHSVVIIHVLDVNDNDPIFRSNPYYASIPENTEEGTAVLTVTADDADLNRTIRYSLLPPKDTGDGPEMRMGFPLAIHPDTGVIEVTAKIDREARDWLNFTVVAEDTGTVPRKRHAVVPVILRVTDTNDNNVRGYIYYIIMPLCVFISCFHRKDKHLALLYFMCHIHT